MIIFVHTSAYGNCTHHNYIFSILFPTSGFESRCCDVYCGSEYDYNTKYVKKMNINALMFVPELCFQSRLHVQKSVVEVIV